MSSFGQNSAAPAFPYEDQEQYERETFFKALFHDDRDSYYFVSTSSESGWIDNAYKASAIIDRKHYPRTNCYVTRHGYNSRQREGKRIRQFNSMMFDLDCHRAPKNKLEAAIEAVLGRVFDAVSQGSLPSPNLIVDSGRGIQLYYVFHRSIPHRFIGKGEINEKGISFYKDVYRQLARLFDEIMDGLPYVEVDKSVFDDARVGRIPGTYNTKAGRNARLVYANEAYFHLPDLAAYKPVNPVSDAIPKSLPIRKANSAVIIKFNHMLMSRLNKVVELQEYRGYECEGSRELMSFVFYNTAVQLYSQQDAATRLALFNKRFKKPLPATELNGIIRSVDSVVNVRGEKGHYILKADTLANLLNLTEREMLDLHFFSSKRMVERMEAKRKTKEKRENRNGRIIELYSSGRMTQLEVAEFVGCSLRTVHTVLKQAGMTRKQAQRTAAPANRKEKSAFTKARSFSALKRANIWRPCFFEVVKGMRTKGSIKDSVVREITNFAQINKTLRSRFLFRVRRSNSSVDLFPLWLFNAMYFGFPSSGGPPLAEPG